MTLLIVSSVLALIVGLLAGWWMTRRDYEQWLSSRMASMRSTNVPFEADPGRIWSMPPSGVDSTGPDGSRPPVTATDLFGSSWRRDPSISLHSRVAELRECVSDGDLTIDRKENT